MSPLHGTSFRVSALVWITVIRSLTPYERQSPGFWAGASRALASHIAGLLVAQPALEGLVATSDLPAMTAGRSSSELKGYRRNAVHLLLIRQSPGRCRGF
jgi:hypothetical protein